MTREELVTNLIKQYSTYQLIKQENGDTKNARLDYEIKTTAAQMEALGINVENLNITE